MSEFHSEVLEVINLYFCEQTNTFFIGTELASVAKTSAALQNQYQNVIDGYSVFWIDFYLDAASTSNRAVTDLRNQVLRTMQSLNPNIRLSYSLPVTPTGLEDNSLYVLQSAAKHGVRVDCKSIIQLTIGSGEYFSI